MACDIRLLQKYNVGGPRYTSYPTVPHWSGGPTESEWIQSVAQSLRQGVARESGVALYIHIPFCESLCTYCGCNTRIARNHGVAPPYVRSVLKEWQLYLDRLKPYLDPGEEIKISEIHLGGGTPTFLSPKELRTLISGILTVTPAAPDFEFSVETDPRVTHEEHLATLFELGFRRLSLGIQDFDPVVQKLVNRVQDETLVAQLTETARRLGFNNINYDLIFGLPQQTAQSIHTTMAAIARLRPDRIAFYGYTHVPWIRANQRKFSELDLPSPELRRELYLLGRNHLEAMSYQDLGMDHFALPQDPLWSAAACGTLHRNFVGYSARQIAPLIGLGVSAIGDTGTAFSQNEKQIEPYQSRIDRGELPILRGHVLTDQDLVLRRHILNLLTRFATEWTDSQLNTPFLHQLPERLKNLAEDGLIELSLYSCRITDVGRPFLKNICMAFDARLATKMATALAESPDQNLAKPLTSIFPLLMATGPTPKC